MLNKLVVGYTSLVCEPVRYQPIPNWRVQLPGRHRVGQCHRDREGGSKESL
jgi:hypothetical protein